MLEDRIKKNAPLLLSNLQRDEYFEEGAVLLEKIVDDNWLKKLQLASEEVIHQSRELTQSGKGYILEAGHSIKYPRLKRLSSPVDHHPAFWDFVNSEVCTMAAADVVGPNVKYHHSKLNFKWANGGAKFDWHQDIQAWPHTDYSPVTLALYLEDCDLDQGPMVTIKGSHKGPLFSMFDETGNWVLRIEDDKLDMKLAKKHPGPAGSLLLLNCRTVHGSERNDSNKSRPLLLNVFSSADSMPYTLSPIPSAREGTIVRGQKATWASHDPRPCQLPPDWSKGYEGPWSHQNANFNDLETPRQFLEKRK
ncbi:MAG: phytanoyl-CoA dioxygenase [Rhodospirillaceae bacterium]|nr:phytanoyl-CoA dioxygenase [Rhodospirillaceae bacterium]